MPTMIIKKRFHTYRKEFPIAINNMVPLSWINQATGLILDLSELCKIPKYCYITRHTDDVPDSNHLEPFKERFREIVNQNQAAKFGIPTIWFVAYLESYEPLNLIKNKLSDMNIKYWEVDAEEYNSIESISTDDYAPTPEEAKMFPKFLHQVTQISIDLLRNDATSKLVELKELESMQGSDLDSKINELKEHLEANSKYYRKTVERTETEKSEFWSNFRITHLERDASWPHFLFNTCGV